MSGESELLNTSPSSSKLSSSFIVCSRSFLGPCDFFKKITTITTMNATSITTSPSVSIGPIGSPLL
ncbi:MAG: hypothetical protein JRF63_04615 [Deltaproteobacteria bacterium]|nr:hypothetical protein [Deltaproteobacteria bacterium]